MELLQRLRQKISHRFTSHSKEKRIYLLTIVAFWAAIFCIFYFNTFHEKYPDEFDNLLGGKYILHGILPFSGFFSHHGPVAYFVGGFVQIFSGPSFVAFRIWYAIFLFALVLGTYLFIRRSVGETQTHFYYIFAFLLACASTYYWLHMLIADSLAAFFVLPVFALLFLKTFYKQPLSFWDLSIISVCTFLMTLTAITYVYVAVLIGLFTLYIYFMYNNVKVISRKFGYFLTIFLIPPVSFVLYLFITGSFSDYVQQSIIFNQRYYIYNYPGAEMHGINPVRYAVMTFQGFVGSYQGLFVQIPQFNFAFPVNVTFALGNIVLFIYCMFTRRFGLSAFLLFTIVFSNMRSNPLDSAEKDYQASVYVMLSLFSLSFIVMTLYREISKQTIYMNRVIFSGLFLLLTPYFLASALYLYERGSLKAFAKYMGDAPLIYDRPEVAPILNQISTDSQTIWMGPLEFEEMYYLNFTGNLATKYHFLIPGMGRSPKARQEMISELKTTQPDILWFDKNFFVLGQNPQEYAPFFVEYVDENYTPLGEIEKDGSTYQSLVPKTEKVDLERKLYIRNSEIDSQIQMLLNKNLIKSSE